MRRLVPAVVGLAVLATATNARAAPQTPRTPAQIRGLAAYEHTLVELDRGRWRLALPTLRLYHAELVSRRLLVWSVSSRYAGAVVGALTVGGTLRAVSADRPLRVNASSRSRAGDPLLAAEYWIPAVRANRVEPPPAGVPVTVVDTGLDVTHPEFAGRPATTALNRQAIFGRDDDHGTAVSSVIAAPANDVGLVGIYPQATLNAWDASPDGRGRLSGEIRGIDAATRRGPGVINLSLGSEGYDPIEDDAIQAAYGEGLLIVASSGNEFEQGNPPEYPASLRHVLTISATNRRNEPASFSSSSRSVDLSAPGEGIPVAVPLSYDPSGYDTWDGTSLSAPLVSGAAAWVWTERPELDNTQLFEVMRRSARDIWERGRDNDTGYGLLDIPRALAFKAPAVDPQEPNDDIDQVKPNGLFVGGSPLLTTRRELSATIRARVDRAEDADDVYRLYVPPRHTVVVYAAGDADVNLALWGAATASVHARPIDNLPQQLLVFRETPRRQELVRWSNRGSRATVVYAHVEAGAKTRWTSYALSVRTLRGVARR